MHQNDDERFESFLRQFRPRSPRPLPIEECEHTTGRRFVFAVWATAVGVLIAAVLTIIYRPAHAPAHPAVRDMAGLEQPTSPGPLTLGRANALLMQAPSISAALDSLSVESQSTHVQKGARSALATLAQADFKERL